MATAKTLEGDLSIRIDLLLARKRTFMQRWRKQMESVYAQTARYVLEFPDLDSEETCNAISELSKLHPGFLMARETHFPAHRRAVPSLLHLAAQLNQPRVMVHILQLRKQRDLNLCVLTDLSPTPLTPLEYALANSSWKCAAILIDLGADFNLCKFDHIILPQIITERMNDLVALMVQKTCTDTARMIVEFLHGKLS